MSIARISSSSIAVRSIRAVTAVNANRSIVFRSALSVPASVSLSTFSSASPLNYRLFSSSASTTTSSPSSTPSVNYSMILVDKKDGVATITLNRPKALNALCDQLITELNDCLKKMDNDNEIGCIVITGSQKAFAAGADIKEMSTKTGVEAYSNDMLAFWHDLTKIRKPIIAAVNGYALGGGCELAMMCDIIIAGDNAHFGQPEIKLGTIPGCGGTQRLTRAVGKSKAMELILTGRNIDAEEAEKIGLVSKVVPHADLLTHARDMALHIAQYSRPIVIAAKEAVNAAYETTLQQGVAYERRLFHATFSTADQKEGMTAFAEKRKPNFKHK